MPSPIAGIDPHQHNITIGIVDLNGVELCRRSFATSSTGYAEAIDFLTRNDVVQVGVEGSASWGAHISIALVAAGFDAREVPPGRTAAQRKARRLEKTDAVDAVAAARALLAEPDLGPVQTLEIYDPLVAKIAAVLEHRRMLVETRTLVLQHVQDQLTKLPIEIRDQLSMTGKVEQRLRQLGQIDTTAISTLSGEYRLSWLIPLIAQDTTTRLQIRQLERDLEALLDQHGTTLRDEVGISHISAATLIVEVGNPFRFAR
jgi:transposase